MLEIAGILCVGTADWERARTDLAEAIRIAEELGDNRRWDESVYTLVLGLHRMGAIDEALDWNQRSVVAEDAAPP